jgi:hypothetical protein
MTANGVKRASVVSLNLVVAVAAVTATAVVLADPVCRWCVVREILAGVAGGACYSVVKTVSDLRRRKTLCDQPISCWVSMTRRRLWRKALTVGLVAGLLFGLIVAVVEMLIG